MFKGLITTNNNPAIPFVRWALAIVLFAHGAQKMLGWFGGYGFTGTMGFLTKTVGLPYIVGLLVIIVEFFGAIFILLGLITRFWAFAIICLFIGIVATSHVQNGFFMNWGGTQKGEGFEYHILMMGMALGLLINGAGKWSIDRTISFTRRQQAERYQTHTT